MVQQLRKLERIIEAVRRGLVGDEAVEFIRESGYAITSRGVARHLRAMGGRGRIQQLIDEGLTNLEILESIFPEQDLTVLRTINVPQQPFLFENDYYETEDIDRFSSTSPLYEYRKVTIKLPSDLFEAIRLAAKAENKTQNELIVEILMMALSQMPRQFPETPA